MSSLSDDCAKKTEIVSLWLITEHGSFQSWHPLQLVMLLKLPYDYEPFVLIIIIF